MEAERAGKGGGSGDDLVGDVKPRGCERWLKREREKRWGRWPVGGWIKKQGGRRRGFLEILEGRRKKSYEWHVQKG